MNQKIFSDMFDADPVQGFLLAGRSYLDSQWYEEALTMYERALSLEPGNDTALVKATQLRAIAAENKKSYRITQRPSPACS